MIRFSYNKKKEKKFVYIFYTDSAFIRLPFHHLLPLLATISAAETSSLGKSIFYDYDDEPDLNLSASISGTLENKANAAKHLHNLQNKISKAKEQIKKEQTSRDENVNEYLKLSSKADKQAAVRIKQVFEKKNEKSAKNMGRSYLDKPLLARCWKIPCPFHF